MIQTFAFLREYSNLRGRPQVRTQTILPLSECQVSAEPHVTEILVLAVSQRRHPLLEDLES